MAFRRVVQRGLALGVVDPKAHQAHAAAERIGRAEQSRRQRVVAALCGQVGKAFENAGDEEVQPSIDRTGQRLNARRTGPAPWRLPTELSGPTTLPIEFDSA